jgi:hypothetical protein
MPGKKYLENLHTFLTERAWYYNQQNFIETDPISIPHRFKTKQDIEIAGFFCSYFSVGPTGNHYKKMLRVVAHDGQQAF